MMFLSAAHPPIGRLGSAPSSGRTRRIELASSQRLSMSMNLICGSGGLEPPLIQDFGDPPLNVGVRDFNHSPYSLWLHHLPAFCPMFRAPHGGRTKNKRMIEKRCLHPSHPSLGNHPLNGMQWVAPPRHSRLAVVACHLNAFTWQLPPEVLEPVFCDMLDFFAEFLAGHPSLLIDF